MSGGRRHRWVARLGLAGAGLGLVAGIVQATVGSRIPEWTGAKASPIALGLLMVVLSTLAGGAALRQRDPGLTVGGRAACALALVGPGLLCLSTAGRIGYPAALLMVVAGTTTIDSWSRTARMLGAEWSRILLGALGACQLLMAAGAAPALGLVQLVYPIFTTVTGAGVQLRPDWPWLLIGLFAFHGLAEETVWRGYAYRRLRVGRSFGAAVIWTMPLVAVAHLPIFVTSGPLVGSAALLVAAVTSVPFAHLFDVGRGTIWAPAILHTAIDSFKLVVVPAGAVATFSLLLAAVSLVVPLLALVARPGPSDPSAPAGTGS